MSLLENAYEDFIIMNKAIVEDTYGGIKPTWTEGITIRGAIVYDSSTQMKVAQSMGVTGAYTLTVKKNMLLDYYDVIKRVRDGKYFRVLSNSDDNHTPDTATLNMRQYSCEEFKIT